MTLPPPHTPPSPHQQAPSNPFPPIGHRGRRPPPPRLAATCLATAAAGALLAATPAAGSKHPHPTATRSNSTHNHSHRHNHSPIPSQSQSQSPSQNHSHSTSHSAAEKEGPTISLEKVPNFGTNPGNLSMYVYRPPQLPSYPAVVVALHGCTQSAQLYADNSGLTTFADRYGFLLVFAETTSSNNPSRCFNWFQPLDNQRGQGEAASIRQMVAYARTAYGTDPSRTYVTGLSAGGAMTSVMLATYPDVFAAGAVIAGLPYNCTKDTGPFTCMNPGVDRTPATWAQRVRDAYPSYAGPWPRVAIWHGDNDTTVAPRNADELRDQWTAVHGLGQTPDRTSTIGPNATRSQEYVATDGTVAVQVNRVPGIGHGTPVDPGAGPQQCGRTGTAHFIDSICSSYWITRFFGLWSTRPPRGRISPVGQVTKQVSQVIEVNQVNHVNQVNQKDA
ncbi:hypothetical protein JCM4914_06960 [Streptomyces platensis subsp. malvinus]